MKRKQRTKQEKAWHEWLAQQGCAICGDACHVHHAVGSHGSHNKVAVGGFFCVPLCPKHHLAPGGIHGNLAAFDFVDLINLGQTRKEIEKSLFEIYAELYERKTGEQIPEDVKQAIKEYHK